MYLLLLVFMAFQIFGIFMFTQNEAYTQDGVLVQDLNESEFIQLILSYTPSWVMVYIAVFSVYFYLSEYHAGFYKNYISLKNGRIYTVASKIIMNGLFTLFMLVTMVIADMIGRAIFFGDATIGDIGYFSKLLVGQFLLHWAFSVVVLFIAMIVKNMIPSIVLALLLVLNVFGMLITSIEGLIHDGEYASYLLVNTILSIKDFHMIGDILHVLIVALVFLAVFCFLSIRYKIKEDLR